MSTAVLCAVRRGVRASPPAVSEGMMSSLVPAIGYRVMRLHYILLERGADVDDVGAEGDVEGMWNADTDPDSVHRGARITRDANVCMS